MSCLYPGSLRTRIRQHASEGHKVKSDADMKAALDHNGGVKNVQTAVVRIIGAPSSTKTPKWQGIQTLNNFRH